MKDHVTRTIGITGSGRMGADIFYLLLDYPFRIAWACETEAHAEEARSRFKKKLERSLSAGAMDREEYGDAIDRVAITAGLSGLSGCGLVIEAVTESLAVKVPVLAGIEAAVAGNALILSNSSSFIPSRLYPGVNARHRFAGLHFFYPVKVKSYCELVAGPETSSECLASAADFAREIGKEPLLQSESHAFFINRTLLAVQAEACRVLEETGISPAALDRCLDGDLGSAGIFLFMDAVGLDVMLAAVREYAAGPAGTGDTGPLVRSLEAMIGAGRLGKKNGRGYVTGMRPGEEEAPGDEMRTRLCAVYANAACRFVEEGACGPELLEEALRDCVEADLGPFGLARKIGVDRLKKCLSDLFVLTGRECCRPSRMLDVLP